MLQRLENVPFAPYLNEKQLSPNTAKRPRVLVEVTAAAEVKTAGGIFLPQDSVKNDAKEAIIVAFDDEHVTGVTLGQKVIVMKFRSQALKHEGREFRIVDADEDLLGTVDHGASANATFQIA
jgi:co-chaperonin GroES (HSP10)